MIMQDQLITWTPGMTLDLIEKIVILKAFAHFRNNKTATASSLGIAIRTLDYKLDRYEYEDQLERKRQEDVAAQRTEFLARQRGNPPNNLGIPYNAGIQYDSSERHFPSTPSGIRMESIANSTSQQPVSMPERSEIQTVLPKHSAKSSKTK